MTRSAVSKIMRAGRATVFLLGLAVILALLFGVATMALGADGNPFILGEKNTASEASQLVKSGAGPALTLKVGGGAPLAVNSSGKVQKLNADRLDGLNSSAFQGKYAQTVTVAKSGGDFTSVQAALDSITDAGAGKHYLVWVGPGTYDERVVMKPFVDIEGAGELSTTITAPGGANFGPGSSVVSGASDAELRELSIRNTGGAGYAIGIYNASASPRLSNLTATGEGGQHNRGVVNAGASPTMTGVSATASGGDDAFAVDNFGGSDPTMADVIARASGANYNVGVVNANSSPTMTDVTITASGGSFARAMENSTSSPKMTGVSATASGGSTENTGMYNYLHSSPTVWGSVIGASGPASRGVYSHFPDDSTSLVTIENSEIKGTTNTVRAEGGYKIRVGASKLDGGPGSAAGTGSEVRCAGVHDENYNFSAGPACP